MTHVSCRRCQRRYAILPMMAAFAHWFCIRDDAGRRCGTFNRRG